MQELLTLFVALTAVAVVTQAIVLIAIYYSSRRLGDQIDRFMRETREVMVPIKGIAENLRVASNNLVDIGNAAREQFRRVEVMVTETGEALHKQLDRFDQVSRDIVSRINETATIVQESVIKPVREVSAVIKGISRAFEVFRFFRNRSTVDQAHQDEELFI